MRNLQSAEKFTNLAFTVLTLMQLSAMVDSRNTLDMAYDNITCISKSDDYMAALDCNVGKSAKRRGIFVEMQFKKDIPGYYLNVMISLPRPNASDFVLVNLRNVSGCDMLSNRNQVTFISISRQILDRYSNLPNGCPLKKNILYYIRGFRMDLSMIPAFSFETRMHSYIVMLVSGKPILTSHLQSHSYLKTKAPKG